MCDTNVLIRFLVRDDEDQFDRARKLIRREAHTGEPVRIGLLVFILRLCLNQPCTRHAQLSFRCGHNRGRCTIFHRAPRIRPFSLAQQGDSREMSRQTVEAQERSVPDPFQDATAERVRRRADFSLHFGLYFPRSKSLIQLIYVRCSNPRRCAKVR